MISNFTPRLYQEKIFATASSKNTLVVLPTGLGKTNIFLMLAAHRLKQHPNSKILLLGPTKPLIDQYYMVFRKHLELPDEQFAIFTGDVSPEKRQKLWESAQIIFSTPQGLENDIITRRILLDNVSLLGFDEAHRAVGNYSYVFVAKQYQEQARFPRIVALTASPGSDMEKIRDVCRNLFIEDVEARDTDDADVKPYIQEVDITWNEVSLTPPFIEAQKYLQQCLKERVEKLKALGVTKDFRFISKKELLGLQIELQRSIATGDKNVALWQAVSIVAEIMKVYHGIELVETQGIEPAYSYLKKIFAESLRTKVKAIKNLVQDGNFKSAYYKIEQFHEEGLEHPKLIELQKIVQSTVDKQPDTKLIVFNQFRDNAVAVKKRLNLIKGVKAEIFVGQQKKGETGSSQKEQKKILDDFREGLFNVLVATSIGEEGLDIPQVDLVVFYEPVPSAIRTIQRRGRTGRHDKGQVIILVTKDTRDVAYKWSAHHKEKQMYRNIGSVKREMTGIVSAPERPLTAYIEKSGVTIYADHRERGSGVIKALLDLKVDVRLESLTVGDYVISQRCAVEFKTVEDFMQSLIDGRLLDQIKTLKENFSRAVLIIQGEEDLYSVRRVHKNAIQGMLAAIILGFGVPIIQTKSPIESASLLMAMAKREQEGVHKEFDLHGEKKGMTIKEQQEYVVSSLPGIGMTLAKPLLKAFKNIKNLVNASASDLEKVEKIGPKKAADIRQVFDEEYEG